MIRSTNYMMKVGAMCSILVSVVLALGTTQVSAGVNADRMVKDFNDALANARNLESASMLFDEEDANLSSERMNLLYRLARQPKSLVCKFYLEDRNAATEEFRMKAHAYLDELKKPNKGPFFGVFGSRSLGSMLSMAKHDSLLSAITERYMVKVKSDLVNDADVDCDLIEYQATVLHSILFLLQTDIKHLLLGDQQVLNEAIYDKLKSDEYVSPNNFYESAKLKPRQKEVLLAYFADRVDTSQVTLAPAADHFNSPSEYIFGRVMDSCVAALSYQAKLDELELDSKDVCPKGISNPGGDQLFVQQYSFDRFQHTIKFCKDFLDAL